MLRLRPLTEGDVSLVKEWLNKEHVKKWYEIPRLGVTADIDAENKASEKALLSCGFELYDAESSRYLILKESCR